MTPGSSCGTLAGILSWTFQLWRVLLETEADRDRVGPDERGTALDKLIFAVLEQVSREPMRALTRISHLETLLNPGGHGIILRHY